MKLRLALGVLAVMVCAGAALSAEGIRWRPLDEPGCGGWMTSLAVSPFDSNRVLVGGDMLGIGLSTDRGERWQSTFGLSSWEIGDFTWHPTNPDIIWAGTMSGPALSTDGGVHWQVRRSGLPPMASHMYSAPIEKVLFDPADASRLLAFGGSSRRWNSPGTPAWGGVWESTDGGQNWKRLATITSADGKGRNIVGATFAAGTSPKLYAAVNDLGIFISADGGRTWRASNQGLPHLNVERIVAHPRDPGTLWVSLLAGRAEGSADHLPGGIYRTTDGGATWHSVSGNLPAVRHKDANFASSYKGFAVAASNPDVMYATDGAWNTGIIYRTSDGGKAWRPVASKQKLGGNPPPARVETAYFAGAALTVMTVDPRDPDAVFGAGSEYILRSLDGGASWIDATAQRISGDAWRGRGYSGLCCINFRFDPYREGRSILLAMDAGKNWESVDGLRSWTFHGREPWPWGAGNDAAFTKGPATFSTTGQFGSHGSVLRTLDGVKWTTLSEKNGLPKFNGGGIATGIYALPDDPAKVWVIFGGRMFHSVDAGDTWTPQEVGPKLGWIAGDPTRPTRFYVSGERNVYVTEDGETFTPIGGPKTPGQMTVDPRGRLYVAAYRGKRAGLWRYEGQEWTRLLDEWTLSNVAVDPKNPDRIAVATNDDPFHDECRAPGVLISADGGRSWAMANDGLVMTRGHAIAFNPFDTEQIIFGSLGRGYFVARWAKDFVPETQRTYVHTADDAEFSALAP